MTQKNSIAVTTLSTDTLRASDSANGSWATAPAWRIEGALSIAKVRGRDGVLMTRKFLKSGRTGSNFFERCT